MDYRDKVFEMLGVKPGEIFKIKVGDEISKSDLKLTPNLELLRRYHRYTNWNPLTEGLVFILTGGYSIVKEVSLTKEQKSAIEYARACGCKWVAKDKNGMVEAYKNKPIKQEKYECWHDNKEEEDYFEIKIDFPFISWEDTEPYFIGTEGYSSF